MLKKEPHYFKMRIPEDVFKKLQDSCEKNERSLTAEIRFRLEQSFTISSDDIKIKEENDILTVKMYEIEKELNLIKTRISKIEAIEYLRKAG